MKRPVLCVYAHPDDESFGVAGTIAKLSEEREVQLICVTDGNDPTSEKDWAKIRKEELREAAKILGIKKVHFFNYPDGSLNNQKYHEVAKKIQRVVDALDPELMMTFEPKGISGHLDHVAVSMITNFVFERSRGVTELWMNCLNSATSEKRYDYFIYFPQGYAPEEIDMTINVSEYFEQKKKALRAHQSQIKDVKRHIERLEQMERHEEYFLVRKRPHVATAEEK